MSVRTDTVNLIVNVGGDQAKNELNLLRKKAADLSAEMKGLKKSSEDYKAKALEMKAVTGEMDKLRKSIGLTAMTQKELVNELNRLKAMRASLTPQTKEFDNLSRKIKEVEGRLYDVRNGVFGFKSTLSKIGTEIKQFGMLALGYLGFEFITDAFRNILSQSGKVSDQLADVRRVTGLGQAETERLLTTFRKFDTRTATSQLLDYAKIAGKLGIASNEIASFVQATDQLVTALGDELGDADAITENIGKIINIYDKGAQVTGQRTLQIGNAIVDLANKGVASGNFIVDFTKRLAGIANTANVSLESSIGLAAGLEELGQTSETSSTAVTQLITKIGSDVPKYAALAGKSSKEFATTLRNDPVEALIQLAEGLTKNKSGFAEIATAFKDAEANGVRVTSTLGVIGQKSEFLRGKISDAGIALQGTQQITEAYRLKNETLGATLDKIGKRLSSIFSSSGFIQGVKGMAEGFAQLIGATKKADDALSQFRAQADKVNRLEKDILPLLSRYDDLKDKTNLSKGEQVELNKAIQIIAQTIPGAITEFDKYGRAIALSTSKAKEFIQTQQLVLREKNREAIKESKSTVTDLERDLKSQQQQLETFRKKLQVQTDVQASLLRSGLTPTKEQLKTIDFLSSGITKFQANIGDLQNRIAGQKGILAELTGEEMGKAIENMNALNQGNPTGDPAPTSTTISSLASQKKGLEELERLRERIKSIDEELRLAALSGDAEEYARIKAKYAKLLEEAMGHTAEILEIKKLEGKELAQLQERINKRIHDEVVEGQIELYNEEIAARDRRIEANKKMLDELARQDDEAFEAERERIREKIEKDVQDKQELEDRKAAGQRATVGATQDFLSELADAANRKQQRELKAELKTFDERKKGFEDMLRRKLISQAQYDQEVAKIDAEADDRRREYAIKEMNRRKAMAITGAIINTISGVARAFADYAWPYSLIVGGLIGAAGMVQVGKIASEEIPEAERGMLIKGKRHRDGGTLIEAEDGEVILSRNTVANNPGVVNDLLHSSMYRNGAPINWQWSNPSISTGRVIPQMQNGGSVSDNTATAGQIRDLSQRVTTLTDALAGTQSSTGQPTNSPLRAYVVLRDVQAAADQYNQLRRYSGLNQ